MQKAKLPTPDLISVFGATDFFDLKVADLTSFANATQIVLTALAKGDVILDAWAEVVTAVTGPTGTPTVSIGITGNATAVTGTVSVLTAGNIAVNTAPIAITTATNLIVDFEAGGGNGAAATAGDIRVWVRVSRYTERGFVYDGGN